MLSIQLKWEGPMITWGHGQIGGAGLNSPMEAARVMVGATLWKGQGYGINKLT